MLTAIGIDLGGTTTKFALVKESGTLIKQWKIATDTSDAGKKVVPSMIRSIQKTLKELKVDPLTIAGIGMGSPGSVNRKMGTVTGAYNLNWRAEQKVKKQFNQAFQSPFYLDNDANLAALGEQWLGAGNQENNVVVITLGTGVGGGIIVDGCLLHGANDTAGEIGHIPLHGLPYQCTCGNIGCLETVASARGVVRLAFDLANGFEQTTKLTQAINQQAVIEAKDIFLAGQNGDLFGQFIVNRMTDYLGQGLATIANIVNPSTIVIGGGVSRAQDTLLNPLKKSFYRYIFPTQKENTKISLATLGNDAGVLGAAKLVFSQHGQ